MSHPLTREDIIAMRDAIVQAVHPVRIVLFGSYAKGAPAPDSDIDLCIIEREAPPHGRRAEVARIHRLLARWPVPKDIVVFHERDLARAHVRDWLERIMHEGEVLHAG